MDPTSTGQRTNIATVSHRSEYTPHILACNSAYFIVIRLL